MPSGLTLAVTTAPVVVIELAGPIITAGGGGGVSASAAAAIGPTTKPIAPRRALAILAVDRPLVGLVSFMACLLTSARPAGAGDGEVEDLDQLQPTDEGVWRSLGRTDPPLDWVVGLVDLHDQPDGPTSVVGVGEPGRHRPTLST